MQVKLVSALENKEQLIRLRVYGKSATTARTDKDRQRRTERYTLVVCFLSSIKKLSAK